MQMILKEVLRIESWRTRYEIIGAKGFRIIYIHFGKRAEEYKVTMPNKSVEIVKWFARKYLEEEDFNSNMSMTYLKAKRNNWMMMLVNI